MTDRSATDTQRAYARLAGFMLLFVLASSIIGLIVTSTAGAGMGFVERSAHITASGSLHRFGLVLALVGSLSTVLLAVALFVTVRPVDRNLALVGLLFRVCESAIGATGLALSFGVLQLRSRGRAERSARRSRSLGGCPRTGARRRRPRSGTIGRRPLDRPYAEAADRMAAWEVSAIPTSEPRSVAVERMVVGSIVFGAIFHALRRLAHEHHSATLAPR